MELLGVHRKKMRCYATGGYYRAGQSVEELVREVQETAALGFSAVKLKVGALSAAEDARRVGAVRRALGDDFDILLDANGGWKSAPEAIAAMERLEEFRPYWIEEPVRADNLTAMARIAEAIRTPVATGELEATRWAFAQLAGAARGGDPPARCHRLRRRQRVAEDCAHGGGIRHSRGAPTITGTSTRSCARRSRMRFSSSTSRRNRA
jgi:L-alanine-DL-glutamate epimerase-like enolase superfamily enzyme